MDDSQSTSTHRADDGLRERNVASQQAALNAGQAALTSLAEGEVNDKEGKEKKTFGRTPDGTGEYYLPWNVFWTGPGNANCFVVEVV